MESVQIIPNIVAFNIACEMDAATSSDESGSDYDSDYDDSNFEEEHANLKDKPDSQENIAENPCETSNNDQESEEDKVQNEESKETLDDESQFESCEEEVKCSENEKQCDNTDDERHGNTVTSDTSIGSVNQVVETKSEVSSESTNSDYKMCEDGTVELHSEKSTESSTHCDEDDNRHVVNEDISTEKCPPVLEGESTQVSPQYAYNDGMAYAPCETYYQPPVYGNVPAPMVIYQMPYPEQCGAPYYQPQPLQNVYEMPGMVYDYNQMVYHQNVQYSTSSFGGEESSSASTLDIVQNTGSEGSDTNFTYSTSGQAVAQTTEQADTENNNTECPSENQTENDSNVIKNKTSDECAKTDDKLPVPEIRIESGDNEQTEVETQKVDMHKDGAEQTNIGNDTSPETDSPCQANEFSNFIELGEHQAVGEPQQAICYDMQTGVTFSHSAPLVHPYDISSHNANGSYLNPMVYPQNIQPMVYYPNFQEQAYMSSVPVNPNKPPIDIYYNGMHYYHPSSLPRTGMPEQNVESSSPGFYVNPLMQSDATFSNPRSLAVGANEDANNASFVYPAIYVSEAGLVTVLLRNDVSVEMTIDQTIRIVSHQKKLVILTNGRGSVSYAFHPAAKIIQDQTTTEAELFLGRQVKYTTESVSFANKFKCFKFDYHDIREAARDFGDMTNDSSISYLFPEEPATEDVIRRGIEIANEAQYEQTYNGGFVIRVNGAKIIQTPRFDVVVNCGPRFMKMSPTNASMNIETHFVDLSIGVNWSVKVRRGSHTLNASHCGMVVSNGKIEAGFDQDNFPFAVLLPRRIPILHDYRRPRRFNDYRSRPKFRH